MVFEEVLELLGREPILETGLLLAGPQNPAYIHRQLAAWVNGGKLWQLRRGLYVPTTPYQKVTPHPFLVANRLVPGSYVSLQTALAYFGLIPEYAPGVTCVTARKPGGWNTPFGEMIYRSIRRDFIFGYRRILVAQEQFAFVATPEKALLDLVCLEPGGDQRAYLSSLRLQNVDRIDPEYLLALATRMKKPKLMRAAMTIIELYEEEQDLYATL